MNIKYRGLKAFVLAAGSNSFTQAAELLGVTQPSFSNLIRDLENVLDVKLFERTTRSVRLTHAGEEFRGRVLRPLADLEEAYQSMQDVAALRRGIIVLGALPSTSLSLIPPVLGELRRLHPSLQTRVLEAHNDELIEMLRLNQIEFALATVSTEPQDLRFEPLIADSFFVVYPPKHPIGLLATLHWRDLVSCDLILLSKGSNARQQFDHAVQTDQLEVGLRYDVTHMTTSVRLVYEGLGLALLPRLALPSLALQGLLFRPIEDKSAQRVIGILTRKDRNISPAAAAFIRQAKAAAKNLEHALPPLSRHIGRSGKEEIKSVDFL